VPPELLTILPKTINCSGQPSSINAGQAIDNLMNSPMGSSSSVVKAIPLLLRLIVLPLPTAIIFCRYKTLYRTFSSISKRCLERRSTGTHPGSNTRVCPCTLLAKATS
jgi:hypothetical protein